MGHGGIIVCVCRKENLWPHLREFADRGIAHCKKTLVQLTEAHTPCELFAVHGHYADAGPFSCCDPQHHSGLCTGCQKTPGCNTLPRYMMSKPGMAALALVPSCFNLHFQFHKVVLNMVLFKT